VAEVLWRLRRIAAIALALAPALAGCGDSGGDAEPVAPQAAADGAAELTRAVGVMQRKGTAEFTLVFTSDGVSSGQDGIEAQGAGIVDFRNTRAEYRVRYDEAPGVPSGTEIDLFSDGSETYARASGTRQRYELQEPDLVASGPADSFKYIATDTVGVHETGTKTIAGRACTIYEGKLDFARIRARAPAAHRAEFDRRTRGVKTQDFSACIDKRHVVREYGFEVRVPGGGDLVLRVASRFTRVGSAEPLRALKAGEKA
jgi:hypothetical protein